MIRHNVLTALKVSWTVLSKAVSWALGVLHQPTEVRLSYQRPLSPLPRPLKDPWGPAFALTCYWIVDWHDPSTWHRKRPHDPGIMTIRVEGGQTLELPSRFVRAVMMEGSAKFHNTVLGYDGKLWRLSNEVRGAANEPLTPFHSIAVDRQIIKLCKDFSCPELEGLTLPNGGVHNGIVRSQDTGGAIKGYRVDLFVGLRQNWLEVRKRLPTHIHLIG